jgi:hypothetical protein
MATQSWCITINTGSSCASFDPDVFGSSPGAPLQAQLKDEVAWNNQTADKHQIALTDEKGTQFQTITDTIEAYQSSFPGYVTKQADVRPPATTQPDAPATQTIYYCCTVHDGEKGQITVVHS